MNGICCQNIVLYIVCTSLPRLHHLLAKTIVHIVVVSKLSQAYSTEIHMPYTDYYLINHNLLLLVLFAFFLFNGKLNCLFNVKHNLGISLSMCMQINTSILDSLINAKAKCAVNLTQFSPVIWACDVDDVQIVVFCQLDVYATRCSRVI